MAAQNSTAATDVEGDVEGDVEEDDTLFPISYRNLDLRLPDAVLAAPPHFSIDEAAITGALAARVHVFAGHPAHTPGALHVVHDVEDDDGASDTSSAVDELTDADFPRYFDEREGRLFHSHGISSSYTFPVDGQEWNRLDAVHELLKHVLGSHVDGPVMEVLGQAGSTRTMVVVDLCTGTGNWAMDMARESPRARFRGFDMVPIMTRYPLENVHFEIGDVREHLHVRDSSADVVHVRMSGLSFEDYHLLLREASRILRAGGIFIAAEWGCYPALGPAHPAASQPALELPHASRFWSAFNERVNRYNTPLALCLPTLIGATGVFQAPTTRMRAFPLGTSLPGSEPAQALAVVGKVLRRCMSGFVDAAVAGNPSLAEHAEPFKQEMNSRAGAVAVWHTVWSRKL